VTINSSAAAAGVDALSPKLLDRISTLSLVPGLSLGEIKMRKNR